MNVVLVEDSLAIRRLLMHCIEDLAGVCVQGIATREDEAIALIRKLKPDLVLLDLALEAGSGLEVLRSLRQEGNRCKVVVITHLALDSYRVQCDALGIDGFFDKSSEIPQFLSLIRSWSSVQNG